MESKGDRGRSDNKVTSDSELRCACRWSLGLLGKAGQDFLPQGLHLKAWPRKSDPSTFGPKKG